jgi:hypothetical protein
MCPVVTMDLPCTPVPSTWSEALTNEATRLAPPPLIALPSFSHVPPKSVTGIHQWPLSLDAQNFPDTCCPGLSDILIWVLPYLTPLDLRATRCLSHASQFGPEYGPLWFVRPWSPNRRRRWGFGALHRDRTIVNDEPPKHLMLHFIWQFLTPADRYAAAHTCSQWYLYQQLRWRALLSPIASLRIPRPPP